MGKESKVRSMGPLYGPLGLKGTYRAYNRYIRIPELRAHTRGPRFQPWSGGLTKEVNNGDNWGICVSYTVLKYTCYIPLTF